MIEKTPALTVTIDGKEEVVYGSWPHQLKYHASEAPNLLGLGTRGTGKSLMLRMDAIFRCLMIPNFRALIIRRTMPELRESHLVDAPREITLLGGVYNVSTNTGKFPNGSRIVFRHCETEADVMNFLSSQYGFIGFDELSTFTLEQFLKISAAARVPKEHGYRAVVRACSNPLGIGADWMYAWFVDHDVHYEDYPDYNPADFEMQFSTLDDNPSIDAKEYKARLRNLPEHVRRAWLDGERVDENTYFLDFRKLDDNEEPWHVIDDVPTMPHPNALPDGTRQMVPLWEIPWMNVYRAIDWGYSPDPAVCLWFVLLPNKRAIVFKEKSWKRTLAADVAKDIKKESSGMRIVESFCDPTMEIKEGQDYSIGEIFEMHGVPVTSSINDRILYGYAIHEQLNTVIDQKPQIQIVKRTCPDLVRTIPLMRTDKLDPRKIAAGNDHWVVALAYFCMGQAPPSKNPQIAATRPWMVPKRKPRAVTVF